MAARPKTLAEAAGIAGNEPGMLDFALAEFLDDFYVHPESRQAAIDPEPIRIDTVEDAWLAAIAEHLARRWDLRIPYWVERPHRFLKVPHFAGGLESLKAILLAESPLAFRRRLIFVEAEPLRRARMPRELGSA